MRKLITAAVAALAMSAGMSAAFADEAQTVWVDGKGQGSMAKEATKMHGEMAKQGWKFQDLDVYIEDGDMKGMFVTYVRAAAPAPSAAP
ncbi:MAG: hypothetical protein FJ170_05505 [Gammaproteobacteria bacterium]|nr:hypothetical protein [Gammaproteobacteria bacterium]